MDKYLRIGTSYFIQTKEPDMNKEYRVKIKNWSRQNIIDDHGKDMIQNIEKYNGFTVVPDHLNYEQVIKNHYNKYMPLSHKISDDFDLQKFPSTLNYLRHIFGEQLDIGIDYLTILFQKPTQILPILCLVSEERNTGKTTFLNWLKLIFEENKTNITNDDLRSKFNGDWSGKLLIGVDEVLLNDRRDIERLKNLGTAVETKTESKGKDKYDSDFFGKFILCSNNETDFINIDEKEIRFWIRKIPSLKEVKPNLMLELKLELEPFVSYLARRDIKTDKKSRMWFTSKQIYTEALARVVTGSKANLEKELAVLILEKIEEFELDEVKFTIKELQSEIKEGTWRVSQHLIREILNKNWKLESYNTSYKMYYKTKQPGNDSWIISHELRKGRCYTFTKIFLEKMLNC
jgi:hypothetical protein